MQRDVRGILSRLPKTLDDTYERILRDIHNDNKIHARRLLHCLAVAVRPLRVEELAEILAFDFDTAKGDIPEYHADWRWKDQEEAVLSTCASLITIAEHNGSNESKRVVQFSHFSVKEFLMSDRLAAPIRDVSQYHILPEPAHTILAQACLGFLLHLDDHVDTERVKDFPLAKYAAEYWAAHAQFQGVASHVKCGMETLFDPDKPYFASWVGIHDIDEPLKRSDNRTWPTPLYYSALCGFHDIAKDLVIKYPQHVNAIGGGYDSPLVAALNRSHVSVAELLLQHGGNINVHGTSGRTPLHTQILHSHNQDEENLVFLRFLVEHGADVNATDEGYHTPLHIICHYYDGYHILAVVRLLLEHGADVNATNAGYQTPLHIVVHNEYSDHECSDQFLTVVRLLLGHGADVHAPDKGHETPLHLAMRRQRSATYITRILLEHGADPNLKNKDGKAPLHILSGRQYHDIWDSRSSCLVAQLLLERGADVNSRDKGHETPLLLATRHNLTFLVRFLLEHGADPNMVYEEGKSLLHLLLGPHGFDWLSINGWLDDRLVATLLDHGADVNARDNAHKTPLLLAMQLGTSDIVRFLLEHGADPNLIYEEGKTLLHLLLGSRGSNWRSLTDRPDDLLVEKLSPEHGVNMNARDHVSKTSSLLVMRREAPSIASFLLQHGADPNMEDNEGNTQLHTLLLERHHDDDDDDDALILQLLLTHGADTSARNKNHTTPLDLAPYYGKMLIAQVLLHNANVLGGACPQ